MGKTGGSTSWFGLVKKAFRSPVKENEMRSSRRREEAEHEEEEEKKRGKRRWIFRKSLLQETTIQHNQQENASASAAASSSAPDTSNTAFGVARCRGNIQGTDLLGVENAEFKERRVLAVAMATTAAAEAAVATAKAAVDIIRLTRPALLVREQHAALTIQTSFRAYLARKALRALKGVVKLQALIRGHNVRKRAKMTLQCMQSLVRVQTQVCDQRRRLSCEGIVGSIFREPKTILELHLMTDRETNCTDQTSIMGDGDDHLNALEKVEALLRKAKEAAKLRENTLACAFSEKMWSSNNDEDVSSNKGLEECLRVFHMTDVKKCQNISRASCHQPRDHIKNIEIDTASSYSHSDPNFWRSQHQNLPITPPFKMKHVLVHSASPRCRMEEKNRRRAETPTLKSNYFHRASVSSLSKYTVVAPEPNYMAATASAKARERSQSAPRHRPMTPEREKNGVAKKRLSFPAPQPYNETGNCDPTLDHSLVSPRCKGVSSEPLGNDRN